jgi:hypothetical protein
MADEFAIQPHPFRATCFAPEPPTDPKTPSHLHDLTTTALFAAQNRNIARQAKLAGAIEALAPLAISATESAGLQSMWEKITAHSILADDVLIDILADAALQGGISRLVLNRLLHNLLSDLERNPDRAL